MQKINHEDGKLTAGTHISYWTDSLAGPISFSKLHENLDTHVVIVGGGIAGISVAYGLCLLNKKVVLVEDGFIGSGETGRSTAHLVNALDDRYYMLEKLFGESDTKLIVESHTAAIKFIEDSIEREKIECDFKRVPGYLFLHPSDKKESLEKEFNASVKAGIEVKKITGIPGIKANNEPCLLFPEQAKFHPLKYLKGICDAIIAKGGRIYTETHAKEIDETGVVTDAGFKISAEHIVVATNTPVNNKYVMHLKQFPYRSYVIGARVKKNSLPDALWWDTGDFMDNREIPPYHYVRLQPLNEIYDLLICGGEDHATGMAKADYIPEENRYALLEDWTRRRFPIEEVIYQWSGQIMYPMDSMGYIGHNPMDKKNIYIVTGDSGNGITQGTIAGILIPDLIAGRKNEWEKIYDPSRVKLFKSGKVFFKEFIGGFIAYLKNIPGHAEDIKISDIQKGEGKIIELDGEKYGAYCDMNNELHLVSAECSHLKCIVSWNNDEKSWDCPCHGSRFTHEGKVLNGPANKPLFYHKEKTSSKNYAKEGG